MAIHDELAKGLAQDFATLQGAVAGRMADASQRVAETFDKTLHRIADGVAYWQAFEKGQIEAIEARAAKDKENIAAIARAQIEPLHDSAGEFIADRAMFADEPEPAPQAEAEPEPLKMAG